MIYWGDIMGELVSGGSGGLMGFIPGVSGEIGILKPFEQEIFLFDTIVAGTSHIEGIEELSQFLEVDEILEFYREVDNSFDDMAIMIKTKSGVKIGYIPKSDNVIFARLMDAGKLLFGKISDKSVKGTWVKIKIKVYLKE